MVLEDVTEEKKSVRRKDQEERYLSGDFSGYEGDGVADW